MDWSPKPLPSIWAFIRRHALVLALLVLLGSSLSLRLYGYNWDDGALYHPDERAIVWQGTEFSDKRGVSELGMPNSLEEFFSVESSLNPHWFPYGSFPLYLMKGVAWITSPILGPYDLAGYALVGRVVNALIDTGTVLLVFFLGARLYSRRVGLLAAAFTTFAVLHIQQSHFIVTDVPLTFFAVLTMFFLAKVMEKSDPVSAALAGLALGLGLASKVSLAPMAVTVAVAYGLYAFFPGRTATSFVFDSRRLQVVLGSLLFTFGAAGVAFVVAQPYAIIDWRAFRADFTEQSEMVRGIRNYPYTRQYVDTIPYWYHIQQFSVWSAGPLLGVVSWLGLLFVGLAAVVRRHKADILILSWVLPYLLIIGSFDVKFLRYMLAATPFLFLLASRMLFSLFDWLKEHPERWRPIRWITPSWVVAVGAMVLVSSIFYSTAYANIYSQPHPAKRMALWMDSNVPKDSVIGQEHWEENVRDLFGYQHVVYPMYDGDGIRKRDQIISLLQQTDYLLFYSNRLYATIPRLRDIYPVTRRYYETLFQGDLGFELVHWETAYPNLLGVSFVDDTFSRPGLVTPAPLEGYQPSALSLNLGFADESYSVYDHPKVMLFQKVRHLPRDELASLLTPSVAQQASQLPPAAAQASRLPLTYSPEDAATQQRGGTWSSIFNSNSLSNRFPELAWLGMVELIFLASLPLGLMLFRALPDRGYLLTKVLGILLVAYIPWLLASLRWMNFTRGSIAFALLLVALASAVALWRWRDELLGFVRQRWRMLLAWEVIFLVAFGSFYALRLANPDLWHPFRGGEKPMDFAYLNAVIRSSFMPPYDPWFAGGYLNYYYFGQFIVATLTKLSGVVPAVAYNLTIPLLFALTFGAIFSVGYNLASVLKSRLVDQQGHLSLPHPWVAGLLAALFVLVLGNLDGMVQVSQGVWDKVADGQPFGSFDYWGSTRLLTPDPPGFEINEFPFFTFLFADLHAHLINLPLTVLSLGLGLTLVLGAGRGLRSHKNPPVPPLALGLTLWANLPVLLALGLTLGALRITNSWDGPTYLLLAAGAIAISEYAHRKRIDALFFVLVVVQVAVVSGLSQLLFLPFHNNYVNFYTSYANFYDYINYFHGFTTSLHQYLYIHGFFIFAVLSFLFYEAWRFLRHRPSRAQPATGQAASAGGSGLPIAGQGNLVSWQFPQVVAVDIRLDDAGYLRLMPPVPPVLPWPLPQVVAVDIRLDDAGFFRLMPPVPPAPPWPLSQVVAVDIRLDDAGYLRLMPPVPLVPPRPQQVTPRQQVQWRSRLLYGLPLLLFLGGLGTVLLQGYQTVGFLLAVLAMLALVVGPVLFRREEGMGAQFFLLAMLAVALLIGIMVDFVVVEGDIDRQNTVFKFYLQAWVLFGLVAAIGVWRLTGVLLARPYLRGLPWKGLWAVALLLLIVSASVYPVLGTKARLADRFDPSLGFSRDGTAYMKETNYGPIALDFDRQAILWLQENVEGSPVLLESIPTDQYRWFSRISVYTGLPNIIGWSFHQSQQRAATGRRATREEQRLAAAIEERLHEGRVIYNTTDVREAVRLLRKYNVRYIYVGRLEQLQYNQRGLAKFEKLVGDELIIAYTNPQVSIYRVLE